MVHPLLLRFGLMFAFLLLFNLFRFLNSRSSFKNKVEMPTKLQRIALGVQVGLTFLVAFMAVLGLIMGDTEMMIVSSVITLIFGFILFGTRRKFKRYYEETDDFFYVKGQYSFNRVYFENISDWVPLNKQIGILDKTQHEDRYICVNLVFSDPEILLTNLADMTFAGKFTSSDGNEVDDPKREQELIDFLHQHGYGYIVKEYSKA